MWTSLLRAGLWLGALLGLVGLTGCRAASKPRVQRALTAPAPQQPLYAHLLGDPRILVVDVATRVLAGTLQHPQFQAASSIAVDSQGHLFVAIDADASHDYREVWKIDPASGAVLARITLPGWAPTHLAMSPHDRLVVGHSLEKPSGTYDLDIIAADQARVLTTLEVPGYVTDVVFDGDLAYIALTSARDPRQSGVLVYDTQTLQQRAYFSLAPLATEPPLAPTWLALDAPAGVLYGLLFQYRDDAPCQQQGRLAALDLDTGQWTRLMDLDDVGPLAVLPDGSLLAGEACPWGQGRLLRLDPRAGRVLAQTTLGPGIAALQPIGRARFAVGIEQDPGFTQREAPPLVFFDAAGWRREGEVPIPYEFGVHDLAGPPVPPAGP